MTYSSECQNISKNILFFFKHFVRTLKFVFMKRESRGSLELNSIDGTWCCYWHLDKFHKLLTSLPVIPEIGEEGRFYSEKAALQCLQSN